MRNSYGLILVGAGAAMLASFAPASPVLAQAWPSRHVSMIVPFAAGSASDAVGRVIAARASEVLGQQVVVENVAGAGGTLGTMRVVRAEPDGYTFLFGSSDTLTQNQSLYKNPQYDGAKDFTPVALVGEMPMIFVLRKEVPANNLIELRDYAKTNGGKMQFGSSGLGSSSHLTCSQMTQAMNVPVAHVTYRGSGPAFQDMLAGHIDYFCSLAASAMPLITNDQVKAIAVLGGERSSFLPNVPTAQEQGFKDINADAWMAAVFPKGVPIPIVAKLSEAISATLDTPLVVERLKSLAVVGPNKERRSPAYLQNYLESEIAKWAAIIKASGVVLN
jgi:tripartite-type tricarboxylate transporter receptor subunit TctC